MVLIGDSGFKILKITRISVSQVFKALKKHMNVGVIASIQADGYPVVVFRDHRFWGDDSITKPQMNAELP